VRTSSLLPSFAAEQVVPSTSSSLFQILDFSCAVSECLQVIPDIAVESPDQKTRGFVVQITLLR
jgi:hypothetical protein